MERVMIAAERGLPEPTSSRFAASTAGACVLGVLAVLIQFACDSGGGTTGGGDDASRSAESAAAAVDAGATGSSGSTGTVNPDAINASLEAAEQYFHASRFDEAELILRRLIERVPNEPAAYELYGRVQYGRSLQARSEGRDEDAARLADDAYQQYAKSTALDDESAGLHHAAAMMASMAGRNAEAIEHLERAVALEVLHPQYPLHLAQMYLQDERTTDAVKMLERVLTIDPDEPYAHATLAGIALERGDFDEAYERIERARSVAPRELSLRIVHARIARQAGDAHLAVELLASIPEQQRTTLAVTQELALAYESLDQYAVAAGIWAERHTAASGDWHSAVQAGRMMLKAGRLDDALSWQRTAAARAPHEQAVRDLADAISRATSHDDVDADD